MRSLRREWRGAAYWPVLIYIATLNCLVEEVLFRGVVPGLGSGVFGERRAVLLSCIAFGLYHVAIISAWFPGWLIVGMMVGLAGIGGALQWLRQWSGSVLGSFAIHSGANAGIGLFVITELLR